MKKITHIEENYRLLAEAIVLQAVTDIRDKPQGRTKNEQKLIDNAEAFLLSDWCETLSNIKKEVWKRTLDQYKNLIKS